MNTATAHDTVTLAGRHDPNIPPPYTAWEVVTPELASEYLSHNTKNRPISKVAVNDLAQELSSGRFLESHQGIAFASDGTLLDGQHRLLAIVKADVPARLLVTRNLSPETWHIIDQGRKRTAGQILNVAGIAKDAPRMAAMARAILMVPKGFSRTTSTQSTQFAIENSDVLGKYVGVAKKHTPAVAAAFAWCEMIGWDEAMLAAAAKRLLTLDFQGEDPMRALARRAEEWGALGQGDKAIREKFVYTFGALQAIREGRGLRQLRKSQPNFEAIARESMRPKAYEPEGGQQSKVADNAEEGEPVGRSQIVVDEDMRAAAALYGFHTPDSPQYDERRDGQYLDLYLQGRVRELEDLAEVQAMVKADRDRERTDSSIPPVNEDKLPAFLRR